jgi:tRNA pseudouridine38-40 synthase
VAAAEPLRTLRLTIAYEGTGLHGWQYQPDRPTVQGLLMEACARVLGERTKVTGASRTDAGVHARGQVASLSTTSRIAPSGLGRALNALLPSAVRVLDAREAPPGFDARRSALGKRYAYLIDRGAVPDPFLRRYAWHPAHPLDPAAMAAAFRLARGKHDFSAFCAAAGRDRSPICAVRSCRVVARGRWLALLVSADSFLHHMVRNLVGSLAEIGRGARPPEWIAELIERRDRTRAGPTAPAHGLTLVRVLYGSRG